MFLRRWIHDLNEKRRIVCDARFKISALIGSDSVIEIGCGFGPNTNYIQGAYLGIDSNPDAIQEAKRRYPTKDFLCKDVMAVKEEASGYNTALFCAVLHEIPDYKGALNAVIRAGVRRILICDYDPELGGWLRFWMDRFEPEAKRWWGCQPDLFLPESEWSLRMGQITRSLLWWEFRKRLQ